MTTSLFTFLSEIDSQRLETQALPMKKRRGDALLLFGEPVPGVYLIDRGEVGIYPSGSKNALHVLGAGSSVGEMSFVDRASASATVRVESADAELRLFKHSVVEELIATHPTLGVGIYRGIAEELSRKMRDTNQRIAHESSKARKVLAQMMADVRDKQKFDASVLTELERFVAKIEELLALGSGSSGTKDRPK